MNNERHVDVHILRVGFFGVCEVREVGGHGGEGGAREP